jgi:hypothetical protein
MAKAYYSMVLEHPAEKVWAVIRPFDHYAWAGVESETVIEEGRAADQVGAVRRIVLSDGAVRRQVLRAHSDVERAYSYALCDPPYLPLQDFLATIRVTPVMETNAAFVEWWATFDCAADERARWTGYFATQGFATWLAALRRFMASTAGANTP